MNLLEHWSKTKIGGVNLLKKPVSPSFAWALSWQQVGQHLPRCYMSLKLLNCLLAPVLFFFPHDGLRALVESFSRKYLILTVTDNVVRPPDGFYAVITSISPSVALWIIQDYVVIPLILIALRFQSKYGNSKGALRSNEVLSTRHDWAAAFISSIFPFYLSSGLPTLSINWATDMYLLFWSDNDLFWAVKAISNHCRGKHIFTILQCQSEAKTNWRVGCIHIRVSSSLYQGTFLMKYLSLTVRPVVTVQLFFPQQMVSCRSVQPLSLLTWLPAMPESFQQPPLSASWSYMNKTAPNFQTMPCFEMYLYASVHEN